MFWYIMLVTLIALILLVLSFLSCAVLGNYFIRIYIELKEEHYKRMTDLPDKETEYLRKSTTKEVN